ncbi:hypothetical protein [Qiania dongpingensis]|uniref:Uncharacterized protein n=1 Tax=Qiania dongpingensis TaxID=2763669 RepID=A0A7G9G6W7_9FIRM|nr:hypothetical protein [Qiania dongpingensis]QNM06549.1 hypothetical protein H9Q78_05295 [Qiania dongpingensis]
MIDIQRYTQGHPLIHALRAGALRAARYSILYIGREWIPENSYTKVIFVFFKYPWSEIMRKKQLVMILSILVILIALLTAFITANETLNGESITYMKISITSDSGLKEIVPSSKDIHQICDKLNKLEKRFTGIISPGKGWRVLITYDNKSIRILGNTMIYEGIISKNYKVSENDILEFISFLLDIKQ